MQKVRGWVSIQGPFLGTPIADRIMASGKLEPFLSALLRFMDGSLDALASLTTANRSDYLDRGKTAIASLVSRVPIICFGSWKEPAVPKKWDTLLKPSRDWLAQLGFKNDGLIPAESSVLTGADYVLVEGVDHAAPVMSARMPFDRVRFTKTLLEMLLRRLPASS
jgi:subtilisin family serine protease